MMKEYYYIHPHKASGRFFHAYIIDELVKQSRENKNGTHYLLPENKKIGWTHHGWHDMISDSTYLICSLRDPVEAIVSYILHHIKLNDREHFFNALHDINNIQSRSFLTWKDNMVSVTDKVEFDKDLIMSRLKRVNFLIDSKDVSVETCDKIREKIASDLGVLYVKPYGNEQDTNNFKTNGSKEFYQSLTKEEIDLIKNINYMDVELYEAAKSLFFPI